MRNDYRFADWLDTFVAEKGFDLEHVLEAEGKSGTNWIPLSILLDALKAASAAEQEQIKTMLVRIDFANGNALHFFGHLAKAIAQ